MPEPRNRCGGLSHERAQEAIGDELDVVPTLVDVRVFLVWVVLDEELAYLFARACDRPFGALLLFPDLSLDHLVQERVAEHCKIRVEDGRRGVSGAGLQPHAHVVQSLLGGVDPDVNALDLALDLGRVNVPARVDRAWIADDEGLAYRHTRRAGDAFQEHAPRRAVIARRMGVGRRRRRYAGGRGSARLDRAGRRTLAH